MKSAFVPIAIMMTICGCSTFHADYKDGAWSVWRGSVLTKASAENVSVKYGEVSVEVNKYSQQGDTEMMNSIGNAIVNGIVAYATYGTVPAAKGAVMLALQPSATNATQKASEAIVK